MKRSDIEQAVDAQQTLRKDRCGMQRDALSALPQVPRYATIVTGVRRGGKSWLLNQWAESCGKRAVSVWFDDLRLLDFGPEDFQTLGAILRDRGAEAVVLDEVQIVSDWERFVSALLNLPLSVMVTGSNAKMLSRELGTMLTGRHLDYEFFPFSYAEYLRFAGADAGPASLEDYLRMGGFPAYVESGNPQVLSALFDDVLYRDIIVRHGIRNADSVRNLAKYLLCHVGCRLSPSRLKDVFHLGSANTVLEYLEYLRECYLVHLLPGFADSEKARLLSRKKVYGCDTGLIGILETREDANAGHKLENLVYWHLYRRKGRLSYFEAPDSSECDFILENPDGSVEAVQVCWELDGDNESREANGLVQAMARFGLKRASLVTEAQQDEIRIGDRLIDVVPAYDFLRDSP